MSKQPKPVNRPFKFEIKEARERAERTARQDRIKADLERDQFVQTTDSDGNTYVTER